MRELAIGGTCLLVTSGIAPRKRVARARCLVQGGVRSGICTFTPIKARSIEKALHGSWYSVCSKGVIVR